MTGDVVKILFIRVDISRIFSETESVTDDFTLTKRDDLFNNSENVEDRVSAFCGSDDFVSALSFPNISHASPNRSRKSRANLLKVDSDALIPLSERVHLSIVRIKAS
jgi:hypothetical protein